MRIAMIAPNVYPVPPTDYGGTERIVHYLTEELTRRGHKVFLFAMKGSVSRATKTFYWPRGNLPAHLKFLRASLPANIDIIHDHYGVASKLKARTPIVISNHGNTRLFAKHPVYVSKTMLMSVGKGKGYYVPNGIRLSDYKFRTRKAGYLLFLGRISREKGVHLAIKVAKKTGKELLLAGPVHNSDRAYFRTRIRPRLNPKIRYIKSVGGAQKKELLSKASCVLFTSIWQEPFGLVMVEALASGTPVLAFKKGAAPEVLKGLPQLLCKDTKEMAKKSSDISKLPSSYTCRRYATRHFSDKVLADRFIAVYKKILHRR